MAKKKRSVEDELLDPEDQTLFYSLVKAVKKGKVFRGRFGYLLEDKFTGHAEYVHHRRVVSERRIALFQRAVTLRFSDQVLMWRFSKQRSHRTDAETFIECGFEVRLCPPKFCDQWFAGDWESV